MFETAALLPPHLLMTDAPSQRFQEILPPQPRHGHRRIHDRRCDNLRFRRTIHHLSSIHHDLSSRDHHCIRSRIRNNYDQRCSRRQRRCEIPLRFAFAELIATHFERVEVTWNMDRAGLADVDRGVHRLAIGTVLQSTFDDHFLDI